MATAEQRTRQLILRGLMPSEAERIVQECLEREGVLPPGEAALEATVTDANIERARQVWYYSPDVPDRLRRILDARDAD